MSDVASDFGSDAVINVIGVPRVDLTSVVQAGFGTDVGVAKVLLSMEKELHVEELRRTLRLKRLVVFEDGKGIKELEVSKE